MGIQKEICLSSVNITEQQDIDLLIEAANDIQNATEASFEHMKGKKWYKRLWEMVTFSKNNIKVIAKNTASLAQMQDIVLKALLMISKESKEISKYLAEHSEQLEGIVKNQAKLVSAISKIKYGHNERPDINSMPTEYQYVIVSAVMRFVDKACGGENTAYLAQSYLRNLQNCCSFGLNPEIAEFNYEKISNLDADGHKLLAVILCEVAALLEVNTETNLAFTEVMRYVGIAPVLLDAIKNRLAKFIRIIGKEFISDYYDRYDSDSDVFIVDIEEDKEQFSESQIGKVESFTGEYAFLSNFYMCKTPYEGISYTSSEAAFQAAKCVNLKERYKFQFLRPREAKEVGKKVKLRPDWDNVRVDIMQEIIRLKFSNNPDLNDKLKKTCKMELIEINTWHDNFWGICTCERCKNKIGNNMLGRLLMEYRDRL